MARWPVDDPARTTPHGKYNALRASSDDGSCGVHPYPCNHPGLDLVAPKGSQVYAPEAGVVDVVATGKSRPFRGYKPGILVYRGASGYYHWLAHMPVETIVPATMPGTTWDWLTTPMWKSHDKRRELAEGQLVGLTGDPNHVHWEVHEGKWNGPRISPATWLLRQADRDFTFELSKFNADDDDAGGGLGLLLLLGLWAYESRGRRR